MACNCKNTAEKAGNYSDEGQSGVEVVKGIKRIPLFILRLFVAILASGLIIIILPFFILYIILCMILGKEIKINLSKILSSNAKRE